MRFNNFKSIPFLLFMIFVFSSFAGDSQEGNVIETILDNGLKVLTVEMHNTPIIHSQLSYKVGSRNENFGKTGLAHITEHMMFKGTPTYPKGKISKLIKDNAGVFNAFTSNDITAYFEKMPKNKIDIALAIEADRMHNCLIDAEELKKELEVIKEERRMRYENSPSGEFQEEFHAVAFKSSPNHWPVIGWMSDISNTMREDVWNFYRTYYTPNNATLVLVGDFETNEMLEKVRKYFGEIPRGPEVKHPITSEPVQQSKRTVTLKRPDVKKVSLTMAWHTTAFGHEDNAALQVLTLALAGKRTSRLNKILIEEKKLATAVYGNFRIAKDPWFTSIEIDVKRENIEKIPKIEEIIINEINKIQLEGITEYELQKMKNRLEHSEIFENLHVSRVASRLSIFETYHSWQFFDEWKKQKYTVTLADVQRVAQKYLNPDHVTIGYLLPSEKNGNDQVSSEIPAFNTKPNSEKCFYMSLEEQQPFTEKIDVIKPRPIAPRIQQDTLANGIPVYFVHDKTSPIFSIRGFIKTGNCPEDAENPGLGALTGRMMNRGTNDHSYDFLIERMDFIPFSFEISGGFERINFFGSSLTNYADSLLTYGFEMLTEPSFPDDGLKIERDRMIAPHRSSKGSAGWQTSRFLVETVYGENHPYSRVSTGSEETLNELTIDDLKKFHEKYYCPQHTVLCVLSDLTLQEAIKKLNKTFGQWEHPNPPELAPFPEIKEMQGRAVKSIPMASKKQADLRLGGLIVPYGHEDSEAIDVASYILGGSSLTSRLGVNIRDNQGLAYRVSIKCRQRSEGGFWCMTAGTKGENAQQLLSSAITEINKMRIEKVTDAELLNTKRYFIGILPMVIETPFDILMQVYDMVRYNMPLDYFDTYADRVMSVTKEDVLRVMQKYFDPDKMVVVGAGPLEENTLDCFKK